MGTAASTIDTYNSLLDLCNQKLASNCVYDETALTTVQCFKILVSLQFASSGRFLTRFNVEKPDLFWTLQFDPTNDAWLQTFKSQLESAGMIMFIMTDAEFNSEACKKERDAVFEWIKDGLKAKVMICVEHENDWWYAKMDTISAEAPLTLYRVSTLNHMKNLPGQHVILY